MLGRRRLIGQIPSRYPFRAKDGSNGRPEESGAIVAEPLQAGDPARRAGLDSAQDARQARQSQRFPTGLGRGADEARNCSERTAALRRQSHR